MDDDDIEAVVQVLRSDWLTTGPKVEEFEREFARHTGAGHAVAVSSGTAALHAAMYALRIGPGDEVIVPPMTFAATANCVVFQGGTPVFADVDPHSLLIEPRCVEAEITSRTKAVVAVDYAGQPCDYDSLELICRKHGLALVADACHAPGARYKGRPVGSLADLSTFSFHPVKHFTTGEGGAVTTDDARMAERMRIFRNHGITSDHVQREKQGSWFYQMVDLGYNYRMTDFQCALGLSQLKKLDQWLARRREIARAYDESLGKLSGIDPLKVSADAFHAYHLYVVSIDEDALQTDRAAMFSALRARGIGVNVHYIPVHLHPFYTESFGTRRGMCPVAEQAYENILSLPIFPRMTDQDVAIVIESVQRVLGGFSG